MNKKILIPLVLVILLLAIGAGWLFYSLTEQKKMNEEMAELAELDKKEMENEYQQVTGQYSEMKTQINTESSVAQLTREQERTQQLLKELQQTKSTDAREIARLKKELATVRAVLRSYVLQIDSLNRLNQNLTAENTRIKGQYEEAQNQISGLNTEKATLSEKVAIAAQLDATNISLTQLDKRGKTTKKTKKAKQFQVSFSLAKNVTAASGMKTVYVRVNTPTGELLGSAGSFSYGGKTLQCSAQKSVEYGGQETAVTLYVPISVALQEGSYRVSIFADGNMIGSRTVTLD